MSTTTMVTTGLWAYDHARVVLSFTKCFSASRKWFPLVLWRVQRCSTSLRSC